MDYYFCHLSRLSVEQKIVKDKLIKYDNRLSLRKPHQLYYFTLYVKVPINSTLLEFWKYSKEASVIDICVYRYYPKYFAISREINFLFWPLKRSIQEILLPRNVSGSRGSQMGTQMMIFNNADINRFFYLPKTIIFVFHAANNGKIFHSLKTSKKSLWSWYFMQQRRELMASKF